MNELLEKLTPTDTNFPVYSPIQVLEALRWVVAQHSPVKYAEDERLWCGYCISEAMRYPCDITRGIQEVLDGV